MDNWQKVFIGVLIVVTIIVFVVRKTFLKKSTEPKHSLMDSDQSISAVPVGSGAFQ